MGWLKNLFAGTTGDVSESAPSLLPRLLAEQKGGVTLAPLFQRKSAAELEQLCRDMPIERLDFSLGMTKQMDWAVQVTFTLAAFVARERSQANYADIVVPRLISRLKQYDPTRIVVALCPEIRDLGLALIKGGRNREALECLRYAQAMPTGSTYGGGAFWIFAATINIAYTSEKRDEIQAALDLVHTLSPDEAAKMQALIEACRHALRSGGKPKDYAHLKK